MEQVFRETSQKGEDFENLIGYNSFKSELLKKWLLIEPLFLMRDFFLKLFEMILEGNDFFCRDLLNCNDTP